VTRDGRSYGGVSAIDRRAERRERLIKAAIGVYGACGYRQATVSAVCREAGLTPRYFYEAFANSEALLAAAFEAVTDFMIAEVVAAGQGASYAPVETLRAMLTAYYDLLREQRAAARVFLLEVAGIDAAVDALFAESMASFAALITRTIDPADGTDTVHPLAATGTMHGLLAIARSWVAGDCATPVAEVVRVVMPLCLLLAPLREAGTPAAAIRSGS